jgi:hypothetical protein
MLCTSCGTEAQPGSTYCANCGATLQTDQATETSSESDNASEPGIASGCLILIRSIFTMPIKTANLAAHELRKIAKSGTIDTDRDFPHLFWCKAMLPVLATVLSALVFLGVLGFAIFEGGFIALIAGLLAAFLAALLTDWFIMIVGEYLMIKVVSARYYTQRIKEAESESERH